MANLHVVVAFHALPWITVFGRLFDLLRLHGLRSPDSLVASSVIWVVLSLVAWMGSIHVQGLSWSLYRTTRGTSFAFASAAFPSRPPLHLHSLHVELHTKLFRVSSRCVYCYVVDRHYRDFSHMVYYLSSWLRQPSWFCFMLWSVLVIPVTVARLVMALPLYILLPRSISSELESSDMSYFAGEERWLMRAFSAFQEISEAKNDLRAKGVMVDWYSYYEIRKPTLTRFPPWSIQSHVALVCN